MNRRKYGVRKDRTGRFEGSDFTVSGHHSTFCA
jgi:hypothetical protein